MKKGHVIELIIDSILVFSGLVLSVLSNISQTECFYLVLLLIIALMESIEYIFNRDRKDSILMSIGSLVSALIIFLIKDKLNFTLAIAALSFTVLSFIIKVYSLKYIEKQKSRLLILRYIVIGVFTLLGIMISISLYYKVLTNTYLFSLLLMSFSLQELFCDILTYVDEIKEVLKR